MACPLSPAGSGGLPHWQLRLRVVGEVGCIFDESRLIPQSCRFRGEEKNGMLQIQKHMQKNIIDTPPHFKYRIKLDSDLTADPVFFYIEN